jgi:ubiquitin-conjugating enzyme E2 M
VFGLEMMFFEPNLEDPLPGTAKEAAQMMRDDPSGFTRKAKRWMTGNYSRWPTASVPSSPPAK